MKTKQGEREVMYENEMCRKSGLVMSCNSCDRIIFKDEGWTAEDYAESGGYCPECAELANE